MSAVQTHAWAAAEAGGASPQQRAHSAVHAWLAAVGGDWRVERAGELQGRGRPGSSGQAVFQFELEGPAQTRSDVVVKCLHRGHALASARAQGAVHVALLRGGVCLAVPRPLHVDAAQAVLLQERARGRSLAEFSAGDLPALAAAVERCGHALRELHELPLDVLGPVGQPPAAGLASTRIPAQLAALVCPAPMTLAARCPPLREWILRVTQELIACELGCGRVPDVPLHRDVHPRQLFVDGERIALIDWDLCGPGDPALDLANLLMHLELRWPEQAPVLQQRLLEGWWCAGVPAGPPADAARTSLAQRIHLYRAFHALRRACKGWRLAAGEDAAESPQAAAAAPPDLLAVARWLDAADHHLEACRRSLAGNEPSPPTRLAAGLQP